MFVLCCVETPTRHSQDDPDIWSNWTLNTPVTTERNVSWQTPDQAPYPHLPLDPPVPCILPLFSINLANIQISSGFSFPFQRYFSSFPMVTLSVILYNKIQHSVVFQRMLSSYTDNSSSHNYPFQFRHLHHQTNCCYHQQTRLKFSRWTIVHCVIYILMRYWLPPFQAYPIEGIQWPKY